MEIREPWVVRSNRHKITNEDSVLAPLCSTIRMRIPGSVLLCHYNKTQSTGSIPAHSYWSRKEINLCRPRHNTTDMPVPQATTRAIIHHHTETPPLNERAKNSIWNQVLEKRLDGGNPWVSVVSRLHTLMANQRRVENKHEISWMQPAPRVLTRKRKERRARRQRSKATAGKNERAHGCGRPQIQRSKPKDQPR